MPKILLIEDEQILSEMYIDKFSEAKFEVISAFDAESGLKIAQKEKPDLIVLDIILPKNDGISFLENLRKNKETSSMLVVVLSNYDNPKAKKEARRLGAMDYLIKTDFTPTGLTKKIKEYLPS
ncbi:response regulator [Candidatus Parcubacteria bacterium]|nr:response regulator [Candidatus Parcubacteria bacterium]